MANKKLQEEKVKEMLAKFKEAADDEALPEAQAPFHISLPVGSENLSIDKDVIRKYLQRNCNLEIKDFHVAQDKDGGRESIILVFAGQHIV